MRYVAVVLLLVLNHAQVMAQNGLNTTSVTIFKDATVYVEKEGVFEVKDNQIQLELAEILLHEILNNSNPNLNDGYIIRDIILGSLHIDAPQNRILSKNTTSVTQQDAPISSIRGIWSSNIGKKIRLRVKGQKNKIEGELFSTSGGALSVIEGREKINSIVLKQRMSWRLINMADVESFEFLDPPILHYKTTKKYLNIVLEKNQVQQKIGVSYLRKGIIWTPNYQIVLNPDQTLQLELNASVLNDVEKLENAQLNLAVGIPVFKYAKVGDPLFSNVKVIDYIKQLAEKKSSSMLPPQSNIMSQSAMRLSGMSYSNKDFPIVESDSDDDIFTYTVENVSLNKGERMNLPLLDLAGAYQDIYTVDLQNNKNVFSSSRRSEDKNVPINDVWHNIQFKNKTPFPLTTGSVVFKKKTKENKIMPISQGMLNYTPDGETCLVRMSIAPNVLVRQSDKELSRRKDEDSEYNRYFVTIQGEIEISNFKNESFDLLVDKTIKGTKLLDSSEKWTVLRTFKSIQSRNQTNAVQWSLKIKPQETRRITYTYEYYTSD